jgi:hypothetical protein
MKRAACVKSVSICLLNTVHVYHCLLNFQLLHIQLKGKKENICLLQEKGETYNITKLILSVMVGQNFDPTKA